MVKKRLSTGEACPKCADADALLARRGVASQIHEVVWALEGDPESEGSRLGRQYGVDLAPFYIIHEGAETRVETSTLRLISYLERLLSARALGDSTGRPPHVVPLFADLEGATAQKVVARALAEFGSDLQIAFSGAEDVVLLDLAYKASARWEGMKPSVFCLDTGRLHTQTYQYLESVRRHYDVEIVMLVPERAPLEELTRKKGLFSFYEDGHTECCEVRKVSSLRRALGQAHAWMTGQRRDQSPTRAQVSVVEWDAANGAEGLVKFNPLADWSLEDVWQYIRTHGVPYNELHDQGYVSIGCAPCTRPTRPGEHPRAGRWWWEAATQRECGLHVSAPPEPQIT
jgi:phosphoadenosine phosphosulfate reductase